MKARLSAFAAIALVGLCTLVIGCNSDGLTSSSNATPILAPLNVKVSQSAWGDVVVTWDRNTQSNWAGYNVYRLVVGESAVLKLTAEPIADIVYIDDTAVWGMSYEYRVTSVGEGNQESVPTSAVIVNVPIDPDKKRPK